MVEEARKRLFSEDSDDGGVMVNLSFPNADVFYKTSSPVDTTSTLPIVRITGTGDSSSHSVVRHNTGDVCCIGEVWSVSPQRSRKSSNVVGNVIHTEENTTNRLPTDVTDIIYSVDADIGVSLTSNFSDTSSETTSPKSNPDVTLYDAMQSVQQVNGFSDVRLPQTPIADAKYRTPHWMSNTPPDIGAPYQTITPSPDVRLYQTSMLPPGIPVPTREYLDYVSDPRNRMLEMNRRVEMETNVVTTSRVFVEYDNRHVGRRIKRRRNGEESDDMQDLLLHMDYPKYALRTKLLQKQQKQQQQKQQQQTLNMSNDNNNNVNHMEGLSSSQRRAQRELREQIYLQQQQHQRQRQQRPQKYHQQQQHNQQQQ